MENKPTVYTTGESVKPNKKWYQTWRIIYPILGVVVIVELILGLKTLLAPLPKSQVQKIQPISEAKILLMSPKLIYKVGDAVPINVRVSTGGHTTSGTDLLLHFDPKFLEATAGAFTSGKIYSDYPLINVDGKNGVINISGIASLGKGSFIGGGDLGVISFKAKTAGKTPVTVDFKKGVTTDSNVIDAQTNEDILGQVTNLNIIIK